MIAYSYKEAAEQVGLKSDHIIRDAVRDGDLIPTYLTKTKPVIARVELERWFNARPTERS